MSLSLPSFGFQHSKAQCLGSTASSDFLLPPLCPAAESTKQIVPAIFSSLNDLQENTSNQSYDTPTDDFVTEPSSSSSSSLTDDAAAPITTPQKVQRSLKRELNLSDDKTAVLTQTIFAAQRRLFETGTQASYFEPSAELPYQGLIDGDSFTVFQKQIGKGAFNDVFKGTYFPTKRHRLTAQPECSPSKPLQKAIKRQRPNPNSKIPTLAAVAEKMKIILEINSDTESVDHIDIDQKVIKTDKGVYFSIHDLFNGDFFDHQLYQSPTPIMDIITTFIDACRGVLTLHRGTGVHRDIKSENILVHKDAAGSIKQASITDHDFVIFENEATTSLAGTIEYIDPSQFGDRMTCLANQTRPIFSQNKSGDIFALGTALGYHGVFRLLYSKAQHDPTFPSFDWNQIMRYASVFVPRTTYVKAAAGQTVGETLRQSGHRVGYANYMGIDPVTKHGILKAPPAAAAFYEAILQTISLTSSYFTSEEEEILNDLAFLAASMRNYEQDHPTQKRPTLEEVISELEDLRLRLTTPKPQTPTSSQQATDPASSSC